MIEKEFLGYNDYPIRVYIWDNVDSPKGVVQIVHGMAEHAGRYDDFANFLNTKGYIVVADDHRGHCKTANGKLGIVPDGDCFHDTVQDLIAITYEAISAYKLPVMLFGHSYGSFLSQAYIQKASDIINGVVLCGSARQPSSLVNIGSLVSNIQKSILGKDKPANMVKNLTFGSYNKKFKKEGSPNAWLSVNKENYIAFDDDRLSGQTMSLGFYTSFFKALKKLYTKNSLSGIRKSLPIYITSGDSDPVGGFSKYVDSLFNTYISAGIENVSVKLYPELRHEILNEKEKDTVYEDILAFIDKCNALQNAKSETV